MIRAAVVLPILLGAGTALASPGGFSVEAAGGVYWRASSQGTSAVASGTVGGRLGAPLLQIAPVELRAELLYQHVFGSRGGTDLVHVSTSTEDLALLLRVGFPFHLGLPLTPYVAGGPSVAFQSFSYSATDPVSHGATTPSGSGPAYGGAYGLGLASQLASPGGTTLVARLEGLRLHRGSSADTMLQLGVGLLF